MHENEPANNRTNEPTDERASEPTTPNRTTQRARAHNPQPAPNLHPTCTQPATNLHPTCTQPARKPVQPTGYATAAYKNALCSTLYFLGFLVGAKLMGTVSDLQGRRVCFYAALRIILLGTLASFLAPNFWLYCAGRFTAGYILTQCYDTVL
jgi:hypothetical protein